MGADIVPILLIVTSFSLLPKYCFAIDNITESQNVSEGKSLISPGKIFELGFFIPNNSRNHKYVGVWYKGISPQTVVWVANRHNPLPATDSKASVKIGNDGNLQLVDGNQSIIWSTNVHASSKSSVASLSDDGNFVLEDGNSRVKLWQSFEHLGDTFLPGTNFGFNVKTGQNFILTSWKSDSDPSLGNFTAGISSKLRPVQSFIWINGSTPLWRTGPWNKVKFIGVPEMQASYRTLFRLSEDVEQGTTYFDFDTFNNSFFQRMIISSEGILKIKYMSKEKNSDWYDDWISPKNSRGIYGVCGPYGVCKESEHPICRCLKGFVPKSNQEWSQGNWTQGCVRKTEFFCEKTASSPTSQGGKKDGFQKYGNMKLPDFYEYVTDPFHVDACQTWCLANCSCSACAFVNGIGCLIWSGDLVDIQEFAVGGEDLFLRLAHGELGRGQKNKKIIISLASVSSVLTLGSILLIGLYKRKTEQNRSIEDTTKKHFVRTNGNAISSPQFTENHDPSELPIFDLNSILVATDYFSSSNKLGQGGFGPVYKGRLQDGTPIAVKRLSSSSGQGMEELKNEMMLISKLQHRNLVKLLGCCIEKEERLLIYEFMRNRSLDNFIFGWFPKATSSLYTLSFLIFV